jgi:hypothetical protein
VNCPKPIQHYFGGLRFWPKVLTPNISAISTANPNATVLVRTFDLEKSALLRFFVVTHEEGRSSPQFDGKCSVPNTSLGGGNR